ncbi:MAG: DUF5654 family protein [Patescibacteria group bacterium]
MDTGEIKKEVKERTLGYIVAALGLVAGLAWNEAIKSLIEYLFPIAGGGGLLAKFLYAILATIVVVIISSYLVQILKR